MAYSKTITVDDNSQISILSTDRGVVTIRIYFEMTSVEIDLNAEQLSVLHDAVNHAMVDAIEREDQSSPVLTATLSADTATPQQCGLD